MFLNHLFRKFASKMFGISILLLFSVIVGAQTTKKLPYLYREKLQKADEYYNLLNFKHAVELYYEVFNVAGEDTAIICKIANANRLMNNTTNAEDWYRRAIVSNENTISPIYILQFAQVLTINGKYDEALYWFKVYYKTTSSDKRAAEAIHSIENISKLYYDTTFYVVYPVSINTPYNEYSPYSYKEGLLFLSDRKDPNSGLVSRLFTTIDSSGNFSNPLKFNNGNKTDFNEGAVTFYNNYADIIFSQNYSSDKISRKKINDIPLQLFCAKLDSTDKWKDVQRIPFEEKNYSYSQPSVTEDGKRLYFSSNLPDGYGGTDLYMSSSENGTWTNPVNLSDRINTPGDEMFPYIFHDTILYFSSNGHGGLGGLDLFKINLKDTSTLENLGMPMNSSNDDFGIFVNNDGLSGYLASNRANGVGGDDIYGFKVIRITITLKIVDSNSTLPVSNADIYAFDNGDGKKIGMTDQEGMCTLVIPVCKSFQIRIEKENYESKVYTFEPLKAAVNQLAVINIKNEKKSEAEEIIVLTDENDKIIEDSKNVIYKVQILANRTPVSDIVLKRTYKGDLKIDDFYEDRWYKYSIGEFSTYREAKNCVYSSKVYDAFIIAYLNKKKVHIRIAKAATSETNIEAPIRKSNGLK